MRYGNQEGTMKGYDPKKRGSNSNHLLHSIQLSQLFGSGAEAVTKQIIFYGFIENTFEHLEGKAIGLFRAYNNFYDKQAVC